MTEPTRRSSVDERRLYVGLELSRAQWTLAMSAGFGVAAVQRRVGAGDLGAVKRALAWGRHRLGLAPTAPVVSCYEAGREGFWVHRALATLGVVNRVVDSSSIEVNRRARRTKTDRLDAAKLVGLLVRVCLGERQAWREVQVPSEAAEAARQVTRERATLVAEQTRLRNQVGSYLATVGCPVSARAQRQAEWWRTARDWQGRPLPTPLQDRIARTVARLTVIAAQLATLRAAAAAATATAGPDTALGRLVRLKGVATTSATALLAEGLEWRGFQNRRQIGGLLGMAPVAWQSGTLVRDQGTRRMGQARLKALSLQLAWNWVRWQKSSALTQWYTQHFAARRRARRIGIVAVARKLIIALWRYIQTGVPPAGAVVKPV